MSNPADSDSRSYILEHLDPANLSIACVTVLILRLPRGGVRTSIKNLLDNIEQDDMANVLQLEQIVPVLGDLAKLVARVNTLRDVYAYPENPEWYWKTFVYSYREAWAPARRVAMEPLTDDEETQSRSFGDLFYGIRDAAIFPVEKRTIPTKLNNGFCHKVQSQADLARFQYDFLSYELDCRTWILVNRKSEVKMWAGPWVHDSRQTSPSVRRFLEMIEKMVVHPLAKNTSMEEDEILEELYSWNWAILPRMGVRVHAELVTMQSDEMMMDWAEEATKAAATAWDYWEMFRRAGAGLMWCDN